MRTVPALGPYLFQLQEVGSAHEGHHHHENHEPVTVAPRLGGSRVRAALLTGCPPCCPPHLLSMMSLNTHSNTQLSTQSGWGDKCRLYSEKIQQQRVCDRPTSPGPLRNVWLPQWHLPGTKDSREHAGAQDSPRRRPRPCVSIAEAGNLETDKPEPLRSRPWVHTHTAGSAQPPTRQPPQWATPPLTGMWIPSPCHLISSLGRSSFISLPFPPEGSNNGKG